MTFPRLTLCAVLLTAVALCVQSCGNAPPDPLAEDVARLAPGILPPLRGEDPTVGVMTNAQRTAVLRARVETVAAVEEPDLWVAECAADAIDVYRGLIAGLADDDRAAARAAAVLLDEPLAGVGPGDALLVDEAEEVIRRLEGVRTRFLAGADRAAPEHERPVEFAVSYAESEQIGALTLANASGRPLDGVVAAARLIASDGTTVSIAFHAARWPDGARLSARVLPVHGSPARRSIREADIVEVRLLTGSLRSRPVRAMRPADGWPTPAP